MALAASGDTIASCGTGAPGFDELTTQLDQACQHLAEQRIQNARFMFRSLPLLVSRWSKGNAISDHRDFFSSALESICGTALRAGCEPTSISHIRVEAQLELVRATTAFDVQTIFLEASDLVIDEIGRLLDGKHDKVITRVQQMLERHLKQGRQTEAFTLAHVAKSLRMSSGHLSRTFRRTTGMTFRDYVMSRRIERARLLLLDPLNNVSAVSDYCGFSTPAYFARVFRKLSGCAPSEFASDPRRAADLAGSAAHRPSARVRTQQYGGFGSGVH